MRTIRSMRAAASGSPARRSATFVSGPSGIRVRQGRPVEPGLAVGVRRDDEFADERPLRAGSDPDVGAAGELEHAQRVRRRLVHRLVARHRRHAEDLELGTRQGEQERERVVLARVAVDQDRDHAERQSWSAKSTLTCRRSGSVP
jgi:hypothetical protein